MAKGLSPRIRVTAPTGAAVSASFNGVTKQGKEVSEGVYDIDVDKLAVWTVTLSDGVKTKTAAVEVGDVAMVEIGLDFATKPDGATLDECSWANISAISDEGNGALYWSVGDVKAVELSGTCGTLSLDTVLYCYILGFDHNETYEGKGIHFGTWKASNGTDVSLADSDDNKLDSYNGTKYFQHTHWGPNPNGANYGGWMASELRYDILGSTNVAPGGYGSTPTTSRVGYNSENYDIVNSPVEKTLMSCLPIELRAVMKPMVKYTDNVGKANTIEESISASVDYLVLLSEFEIYGVRTHANPYEQTYQAQYQYFISGNSAVKYKHNSTGSVNIYWTRSPYSTGNTNFVNANTNNAPGGSRSPVSRGIAPVFKV